MTNQGSFNRPSIHGASLTTRMLQGASIAFVLISVFLFTVDNPNPAWPKYWMVRPLMIVPAAGAMGGLLFYLMDYVRAMGGWKKPVAYIISILGYVVALWMGTVVGLDGTLWN